MKFSVIVPVYNCKNELSACVGSILRQTESDWELLLVDDGSNDGSDALCDQLSKQDPRIHAFHKPNGGASSARNVGLEHAVGDYLLFFDGDDTVEPDLLEQVTSAISETSPQMVIFGMAFDFYRAGRMEKTALLSLKHAGIVSSKDICAEFSSFFADNALSSACNKAFSSQILRNTGLRFSEEMSLYEDLDFVLRFLPFCERIVCLDRALYHYRLPAEKPNINRRVLQSSKLLHNLELLTGSALALNAPNASQRTADLFAEMIDQHLMTSSHSRRELPRVMAEIRESAALRALSNNGFSPSPSASLSWPMIIDDDASALYASLRKRKLVRKTKQVVKPALKKLGLYH